MIIIYSFLGIIVILGIWLIIQNCTTRNPSTSKPNYNWYWGTDNKWRIDKK